MRPLRPLNRPLDRCVTGPHVVCNGNGEKRLVFRCELCGTESDDPQFREGCWHCDSGVLWR